MNTLLPVKYKLDWSKINVELYEKSMVPVVYEKIADHMKVQIDEASRNTETSWDGSYMMVKVPPQMIPCKEVQECIKTLGYGRVKWVNFMKLPAGKEIFTHHDESRKCAINFVRDKSNPIIHDGITYNYDRFFFDCGVDHSIPVGAERMSMQLAFHEYEFEDIRERLMADGWL